MENRIIIEELIRRQPLTAEELSSILNVSKRSVYNYLNNINSNGKVIFSSNDGYFGDIDRLREILKKEHEVFVDRPNNILLKLLLSENPLDYFDLAEYFFVSESTILNDISIINKNFKDERISINRRGTKLYLNSPINVRKKLLQNIIQEEKRHKNIGIQDLYEFVNSKEELNKILDIINSFIKKYKLKLDEYLYIDFILHVYIIVKDKDNQKNIFNSNKEESTSESPFIYFKDIIEKSFNLKLSRENIEYLKAQTNLIFFSDQYNFNEFEEEYYLFNSILKKLEKEFDIVLDKKVSKIFLRHLQIMIRRIENDKSINSPLTDMIKKRYYVLFEVAVLVASEIEKYYKKIKINEEEIALIAVHMGNMLSKSVKKYSCALLLPHNLNVIDPIIDLIQNKFSDSLILEDIIEYNKKPLIKKYDLLFSLFELDNSFTKEYYILDLFDMGKNFNIITESIERMNNKKSVNFFERKITNLFDERFWFNNIDKKFNNKFEIIDFLTGELIEKGLVDNQVKKEIIKREEMSSTAFSNFALPHEFEVTSEKSVIAVIKSEKGLPWDNKKVNIVMLIIFSKKERKYFSEYLTSLYTILEENLVEEISKKDIKFNDFLEILKL
ncbi:BglG family transcription antiterminator [Helcococcus kunzii]|uniref:BglG family transcription antiterminator n=1 Tax=Helcococcus kunzii TaxID=40091 RepID=UPI0024ACEB1E|nr:PTS sugar transporter subunit IIA [Helcococcus kunzii]